MGVDLCYRMVQQFNLSKTEKRELIDLLLGETSISPMHNERKNIEMFKADFKLTENRQFIEDGLQEIDSKDGNIWK